MIDSLESGLFHDSLSVNLPQHEDHLDDSTEYSNIVTIPDTSSPLNENDLNYLGTMIDPLQSSSNHGMDLYMDCIQTVFQLIGNHHCNYYRLVM